MTTPSIYDVVPSKAKTWIALVSGLLTLVVPSLLSWSTSLEQPWPTVAGLVVLGLGAVGVYKAPYKPAGTVLVPEVTVGTPVIPEEPRSSTPPVTPSIFSKYRNPWG